jgi:preprotein translocase subunit SecF
VSSNETPGATPAKRESLFHRMYVGTGAFDVVGKRKRWYIFFALLILVCLASIIFRGFNLGIDFKGGTRISMPDEGASGKITTEQVTDIFKDTLRKEPATVQTVGSGDAAVRRPEAVEPGR